MTALGVNLVDGDSGKKLIYMINVQFC